MIEITNMTREQLSALQREVGQTLKAKALAEMPVEWEVKIKVNGKPMGWVEEITDASGASTPRKWLGASLPGSLLVVGVMAWRAVFEVDTSKPHAIVVCDGMIPGNASINARNLKLLATNDEGEDLIDEVIQARM